MLPPSADNLNGYRNNTDDHPVFEYYWINDITLEFLDPRVDISELPLEDSDYLKVPVRYTE
jgi:hypothetical protein